MKKPSRNSYNSKPVSRPKLPANYVFTYKDIDVLARFVTPQGYLIGREKSGLSQKQQRHLATAVKRARHLALLPFTQTL